MPGATKMAAAAAAISHLRISVFPPVEIVRNRLFDRHRFRNCLPALINPADLLAVRPGFQFQDRRPEMPLKTGFLPCFPR
jgi:hypothetical protein